MLDKEKKVQGISVYAEFRKPGQVMQMLITPDAYTTSGHLIPMSFVRRIVTAHTPKKQWKASSLRDPQVKEMAEAGQTLADTDKDAFTENRMRYATTYFENLLTQGWVIEQKPILIEMSQHDADDIAKGKTPNKMLHRVKISREALGFPELVA